MLYLLLGAAERLPPDDLEGEAEGLDPPCEGEGRLYWYEFLFWL